MYNPNVILSLVFEDKVLASRTHLQGLDLGLGFESEGLGLGLDRNGLGLGLSLKKSLGLGKKRSWPRGQLQRFSK